MKVAVVILNYNGQKFLEQFLPNVIANCDPTLAEIVVADNASTDDSVAFMREHFPDIRLIENGSNGGFATGYNLALRQVDAQYYVLLNSDIEVAPHWIEPVIELMDADPQIDMPVRVAASLTSMAILSAVDAYFRIWRLTSINTTSLKRSFGLQAPACSFVPTCTTRLEDLMIVSLPTWRKLTYVGD